MVKEDDSGNLQGGWWKNSGLSVEERELLEELGDSKKLSKQLYALLIPQSNILATILTQQTAPTIR